MAVGEHEIMALDRRRALRRAVLLLVERLRDRSRHLRQRHAVLRPHRPGDARLDGREIELDDVGKYRLRRLRVAPQALRLGIGLDQRNPVRIAPGPDEILDRRLVDRKEAAGRTVFRRHVGERRAVGHGKLIEAGAAELDEFLDEIVLTQKLRRGEHEVGRHHPGRQLADEPAADHLGNGQRHRLPQHHRRRLDAADAPAEHAQRVDHRGVAVGAEQRVGERHDLLALAAAGDDRGEIFEIDLMADAVARRHDAQIVEGLLRPADELVALAVAGELDRHVPGERVRRAGAVDLDRMIDDEIDRDRRIDLGGIAAPALERIAHRREIGERREAGRILRQHAAGMEGDVTAPRALLAPFGQGTDIGIGHDVSVLAAQQILEQHLQRERQARDGAELRRLGGFEAVIGDAALADVELALCVE